MYLKFKIKATYTVFDSKNKHLELLKHTTKQNWVTKHSCKSQVMLHPIQTQFQTKYPIGITNS